MNSFNSLVFTATRIHQAKSAAPPKQEARTMLQTQTYSRTAVLTTTRAYPLEQDSATMEVAGPAGQNRDILYAELQPLVRRLIRQYGDDAESRRDLAGEIYCRFCSILESFDDTRGVPLRPYLIRQLTTSVYSYSRRQWRTRKREIGLDADAVVALDNRPSDPSREWDHDIATRQIANCLPEAISRLPRRQRQVVLWRYFDSHSFEEIADVLEVQVATARSLLRHGLNNLRRWASNSELDYEC
jgi:RNA polymerase sigma-70 factor (ECF subfamily)